jgi:histidine triad (HIT) family protein
MHFMTEQKTIFHRIRDKELPAEIVFEDEACMAFKDIHPKAPTHLLFIPKEFVESIAHLEEAQHAVPGMLVVKAKQFAERNGYHGYKLVFHVGKTGGQEIPYLHLHFLSQQDMPKDIK